MSSLDKRNWRVAMAVLVILAVSACAHQPTPETAHALPGLLWGLLHGFIAPISFIGSIFLDVRMYAFPNDGVWYDLGFVVGSGILFGGGSRAV